jgi:FMN-dependent oxidoreductase (nitrilotriacetate monooxygenase family)
MIMVRARMNLAAYLKTGPTALQNGAWRHPDSRIDNIFSPERYEHIARVLERGRFDMCFFADLAGVYDVHGGDFGLTLQRGGQNSYLDPATVIPFMSRVTTHLGLAPTMSTSFLPPFHVARMLNSLDHLTGGRIGWNVVTSTAELEALNHGLRALPSKEERYDRADEFLEICDRLWHGWDEDALVLDKERNLFADPAKVAYTDYVGKILSSRGPLPSPRSPQARPVIMQAGSSPRGIEFGARWGEAIFSGFVGEPAKMQATYRRIKDKVVGGGRDPDSCRVLAAASVIVAATREEAQAKADQLATLRDGEMTLAATSAAIGIDLATASPEEIAKLASSGGMYQPLTDFLAALEQGHDFAMAANAAFKERHIVGSPTEVADILQSLFEQQCCDGFILMQTVFPSFFEDFVEHVVPELQRRGLFRTEYSGSTLRENLVMP